MYAGPNSDALKPKPHLAFEPKSYMTRLDRAIEGALPGLTPEETARIRVALVELIRLEKSAAWDAGAEHTDREWHDSEYGGTYWGYKPSKGNPHRREEDQL